VKVIRRNKRWLLPCQQPVSLKRLSEESVAKKQKGINPDLESAISTMLKAVMVDPMASITDKTKVIDRALKLEAIKLKMSDDEWGAGFAVDDEDDKE
jgi:hypothetical protein